MTYNQRTDEMGVKVEFSKLARLPEQKGVWLMRRITQTSLLLLTIFAIVLTAAAQERKKLPANEMDRYVVSAKAGIVSIIDGEVLVKSGKSDWRPLLEGDELNPADTIKTGATGRIEILLNPGTYLRIAENSQLNFKTLTTFNLQLNLVAGSAILEAGVVETAIKFATPQYEYKVTRPGLYRLSSDASGQSALLIRKGKVTIAGADVKDGKKVVVADNAPPAIQAFDKKVEDDFDTWSKTRAKTIIAANKQLSDKRMRASFASAIYNGLWIYDPWARIYTFLPGTWGFNSPYGGGYSHCNPYWYNHPSYGWNGNGSSGNWGSGSGTSAGNSSGAGSGASTGGGRPSGGGMIDGGGRPSRTIDNSNAGERHGGGGSRKNSNQ